MNNREARRLLGVSVKDVGGVLSSIRISNRRVLVIWPNGKIIGTYARRPSARQNRWKNHSYRNEWMSGLTAEGAEHD